jgi:hypothetical protein
MHLSALRLAFLVGGFCGFTEFLQPDVGIIHYTRQQLLPSTATPIHWLHLSKHLTLNLWSWKVINPFEPIVICKI